MESKVCRRCGCSFTKDGRITDAVWAKRRYCSQGCYGTSRRKPVEAKPCENCGREIVRDRKAGQKAWRERRYCSHDCAYARRSGAEHPNWKNGGRFTMPGGYIGTTIYPDHPLFSMAHRSGRIMEHRLVMAESLGRPLTRNETVHHVNGKRDDNRLENLQLRSGRHGKGRKCVCADCGSENIHEVPV